MALVSGANRVDIARLVGRDRAVQPAPRDGARRRPRRPGSPSAASRRSRTSGRCGSIMDPDLGRFPIVWAAAGTPNAVFAVPPGTLRSLANATVAPIAESADRPVRLGASSHRRRLDPSVSGPGTTEARARHRPVPGWAGRPISLDGQRRHRRHHVPERGRRHAHRPRARWSSTDPDRLCRAELRVEGPLGIWTARFASVISDEPDGLLWDTQGLLLVRYGFRVYALEARTGDLRWSRDSGTPTRGPAGLVAPRPRHRPERGGDAGARRRRARWSGGWLIRTSSPAPSWWAADWS